MEYIFCFRYTTFLVRHNIDYSEYMRGIYFLQLPRNMTGINVLLTLSSNFPRIL